MYSIQSNNTGVIKESLEGIVERVTFHNADNGWSILRVTPFDNSHAQETVVVHQTKVFAGATMHFTGSWTVHPKFGRQFQATVAREKKPATAAALERYLGSGLIKGVGPKTARKIVRHFNDQTLDVFESSIERLTEVPGIAEKRLKSIEAAWIEHRAIRNVMMFLQSHGISTLFAVRIYKLYGDLAIDKVTQDPYQLANDFYGIGFFSADRVALSIGLGHDSPQRIMAGIKHVLAAGRNFGHCFLTLSQIREQAGKLLQLDLTHGLPRLLLQMEQERLLMVRSLKVDSNDAEPCYYSRSLYFDERYVAQRIVASCGPVPVDGNRVADWIQRYCNAIGMDLSPEQAASVRGIAGEKFSILTGGPGCGKTTTTRVLVELVRAMGKSVLLAAPTGRAAQRMEELIGQESKTIHRLLGWKNGRFKKNEETPLDCDFIIVDECSMLDISLTASLLKAVPEESQIVFIGDADQLPSIGAGNVLKDIIASNVVPCFCLTRIFRQTRESLIIKYAHKINQGEIPWIESPLKRPGAWQQKVDCLFIDADEATNEQINFINRVKRLVDPGEVQVERDSNPFEFGVNDPDTSGSPIIIPKKFQHVNLEEVCTARTEIEQLKSVLKKVHPWSSLHYGYTALDTVRMLYQHWIPKYYGNHCEIQILTPMTRGSLGTVNLNRYIQAATNPFAPGRAQIQIGQRTFRVGDRVIHRINNYDLGVFNGDIGKILSIDNVELTMVVSFFPDQREVLYQKEDIMALDLAYAITIHKSQGSEFEAVIIPVMTQHYRMLFRNLIYTGLTRARTLAIFVGTRKALSMAVMNQDTARRQTALEQLIVGSK